MKPNPTIQVRHFLELSGRLFSVSIVFAILSFFANFGYSQVTITGGSFSIGITYNGCNGVESCQVGAYNVYYTTSLGATVTQSHSPSTIVFRPGYNGLGNASLSVGTITSAWMNSPKITFGGETLQLLSISEIPLGNVQRSDNTQINSVPWAPTSELNCSGGNPYVANLNYTNNNSQPVLVSGIPGQSPFYLGAGQSLPNPVLQQGQNYQITLTPVGLGGIPTPDSGQNFYLSGTNYDLSIPPGTGFDTNYNTGLQANDGQSASALASSNGGAIIWDNGSGGAGAQDSTLKAGFQALANGQNLQDSILNNITANTNSTGGNVPTNFNFANYSTNINVGNFPTNFGGASSNVWVQNFPNYSNYLNAQFSNSVTSSSYSGVNSNGVASFTNSGWANPGYALGLGSNAVFPMYPLSTFGSSLVNPLPPGGDPSDIVLPIHTSLGDFDMTWSLSDPTWSPVWLFVHEFWVFVLTLGFCVKMFQAIWGFTKQILSQQGMGVQNMQIMLFGSGGNLAGLTFYALIVAAGLTIYGVFITFIMQTFTNGFTISSVLSTLNAGAFVSSTSHAVNHGIAFLLLCFPVEVAVGFAFAYIAFCYTSMPVVSGILIALKLLPSK